MKRLLLAGAALICLWPLMALAKVTAIEDLRPGMPVTVEGVVAQITDEDEFLLTDLSGQVVIYVGPNELLVQPGDRVRVVGQVDDDEPLEIYATEITLDDGSVLSPPHRY